MTPKQQWNDMKSSLSHLDGKYGRGTATASAARQTGTDASVSVHASVDTATAASALARERASLRTKEAEMGEARAVAAAADLDGEVACLQVMNSGAGVGADTPSVAARVAKLEADAGICPGAGVGGIRRCCRSGPSGAGAGAAASRGYAGEPHGTRRHALPHSRPTRPAPSSGRTGAAHRTTRHSGPTAAASGSLAGDGHSSAIAALRAEVALCTLSSRGAKRPRARRRAPKMPSVTSTTASWT